MRPGHLHLPSVGIAIATLASCTGVEHRDEGHATEAVPAHVRCISGLVGERVHAEPDGRTSFHEQWRSVSADSLNGLGFVMSGPDTVFIEHLGLRWTDTSATYSARIPSQNDGRYVHFGMTHGDADSLVFVNPGHDFPQRIVYVPTDGDRWNVTVAGIDRGVARAQHYTFASRSTTTP